MEPHFAQAHRFFGYAITGPCALVSALNLMIPATLVRIVKYAMRLSTKSLTLLAWHSYVFPHSARTTFSRLQPACRPFSPKVLCRRHCHFAGHDFCTTLPEVWHSVGHSQQQPRQVLRLLELSEVPTENAPVADLVLVEHRSQQRDAGGTCRLLGSNQSNHQRWNYHRRFRLPERKYPLHRGSRSLLRCAEKRQASHRLLQ